MILPELRVILNSAGQELHHPTGSPDREQIQVLRGIGKILLVLADLELSKAEKEV